MLQRGELGEWVTFLQESLLQLGFEPGSVDGNLGERTERAVQDFQSARGLEADGVVGPRTWDALGAEVPELRADATAGTDNGSSADQSLYSYPTLMPSERGEWVSYLQDCLQRVGARPGRQDGIFGRLTEQAVLDYQGARGLAPTGFVDNATWQPLTEDVGSGTAVIADGHGAGDDGASRQAARDNRQTAGPDRSTQLPSWVEPHQPPATDADGFHPPQAPKAIIGQIFFVTEGNTLDGQDKAELDKIIGAYLPELSTHPVDFEFHGFADRRHSADHNIQLAQERAETVLNHVKDKFFGHSNFRALAVSHGVDTEPQLGDGAADLARFRRVDIHAVPARKFDVSPPVVTPETPRSTQFQVQLKGGASVSSPGVPAKAGPFVEDAVLEITDVTNGLGIQLLYTGFGVGVGTSTFSLSDSALVEVTTTKPVALEEFVGKGSHLNLTVAAGAGITGDQFEFEGPFIHRGARATPAVFPVSASVGAQAGVSAGGSSGSYTIKSGPFHL